MVIVTATVKITKISDDANNSRKLVATINKMLLKIILINLENMGIHLE